MDARDIRLPENYFDAILCINSYFYFGTDDWYLPYLARFVTPEGRVGIASPCYAQELEHEAIQTLLDAVPGVHEHEYYTLHSPQWWRAKFKATDQIKLLVCEESLKGRAYWLDEIRWLLEECHPRERDVNMQNMILHDMAMLLTDQQHLITYLTIVAEKC
jgi:hypothetical protein